MSPQIRQALEHCPHLPTMPAIATQVLEMGRDPEVDIGKLAAVITRDPALATRILRISNSPLYGQRRRSNNIRQAVLVLGLNTTMTLALSFSLADTMRAGPDAGDALRLTWRRALLAALACQVLGRRLNMPGLEELFLAGLLQDVGVLALEAALSDDYATLVAEAGTHDRLLCLERERLDTDHGSVGAWMMERWGLPGYLVHVAQGSHDPEHARLPAGTREVVLCVAVAGRLADFFLHEGHRQDDASGELAQAAGDWLGLGGEDLATVMDGMAAELPEIERLFETSLLPARVAAGVLDEARDLLVMRNLQLVQQATEQQRRHQELQETAQHWEEMASRDALTGVFNRRFFDQRLDSEFTLATQNGWPLTVGFADLDDFKSVNDIHGHLTGDQALCEVARILTEQLRCRDLIVRYGGEEFLVLLPGTALEPAMGVFERLRRAVAAHDLRTEDGTQLRLTISIGVASHMDEGRRYETVDRFIGDADAALNRAKRGGRNRIEGAPGNSLDSAPE